MATSGSLLVHIECGAQRVDECEEHSGMCWHCGATMSRGLRVSDWQGATFVGQNRVRYAAGTHICEACIWVMSKKSPVPGKGAKEGANGAPNWRNFSVLVDGDGLVVASKGEKPLIREWLQRSHPRTSPWIAAIADSGQKHVVPYAPLNFCERGGMVQFEEEVVRLGDFAIVNRAADLLTAGATKDEMLSGDYGNAWALCREGVREFEKDFSMLRGGVWFRLALWLAQRDEAAVAARLEAMKNAKRGKQGSPKRSHSARNPGHTSAVPSSGSQPVEALGTTHNADQERSEAVHDSGRVGLARHEKAPDRGSQLKLF